MDIDDCQVCGNTLSTEFHHHCEKCRKEGPFCVSCLQHHTLHCNDESADIPYDSSCSDCEAEDEDEDDGCQVENCHEDDEEYEEEQQQEEEEEEEEDEDEEEIED